MTKKIFVRGMVLAGLLFLGLLILRLFYGYMAFPDGGRAALNNDRVYNKDAYAYNNSFELNRKNYASEKNKFSAPASGVADQKYEKIGSMVSQSLDFEKDENSIRELVRSHSALIQFEQSQGLAGNRTLNVGIGVIPDNFDAFILECRKIGKLVSIRIDKADKTNEYKDLEAKRLSLTKAREAMLGLKGRGGKIEELINLENRILEVEAQIQTLGVRLGEFDAENEFCTVKLTLRESMESAGIPFFQRLKVAFEWTVPVYLALTASLFFAGLFTWIFLPLIDRILEFFGKWKVKV